MVQSGTPSWPSVPAQECQCSVLCPGTIGPVACGAPPACVLPSGGGVAWLDDVLPAEQAPTPSSAVTVSAAAIARPVRPLLASSSPAAGHV